MLTIVDRWRPRRVISDYQIGRPDSDYLQELSFFFHRLEVAALEVENSVSAHVVAKQRFDKAAQEMRQKLEDAGDRVFNVGPEINFEQQALFVKEFELAKKRSIDFHDIEEASLDRSWERLLIFVESYVRAAWEISEVARLALRDGEVKKFPKYRNVWSACKSQISAALPDIREIRHAVSHSAEQSVNTDEHAVDFKAAEYPNVQVSNTNTRLVKVSFDGRKFEVTRKGCRHTIEVSVAKADETQEILKKVFKA